MRDCAQMIHAKVGTLGSARSSLHSLDDCGNTMLAFEEPFEGVLVYGVVEGCENEDGDREDPAKSRCSLDVELSSLGSPKSWEE